MSVRRLEFDEFAPQVADRLRARVARLGYLGEFFKCTAHQPEALAAARLDTPDLLVSDVAMPGLTGIDLAIQIKAQYPECKILLFSGQATTQDLLEDARSQGHDFQLLQKPVHPSVMLSTIGELTAEHGLAGSRKSPKPATALPVKAARRILRTPQYAGTS